MGGVISVGVEAAMGTGGGLTVRKLGMSLNVGVAGVSGVGDREGRTRSAGGGVGWERVGSCPVVGGLQYGAV